MIQIPERRKLSPESWVILTFLLSPCWSKGTDFSIFGYIQVHTNWVWLIPLSVKPAEANLIWSTNTFSASGMISINNLTAIAIFRLLVIINKVDNGKLWLTWYNQLTDVLAAGAGPGAVVPDLLGLAGRRPACPAPPPRLGQVCRHRERYEVRKAKSFLTILNFNISSNVVFPEFLYFLV